MIADRHHLAHHFNTLSKTLDQLNSWTKNPDGQFPGDAVALAKQLHQLAEMLLADDTPGVQVG